MVVVHDEQNGTVKLIDDVYNEVIFEVSFFDEMDVSIMIDFLLLYSKIILLG